MRRRLPACALLLVAACAPDSESLSPVQPRLELDRAAIDFGSVFVGFEGRHELPIHNRGGGILTLTGRAIEPVGAFSIVSAPERMVPGADSVITLSFTPSAIGSATARLAIESDDPRDGRVELDLIGQGLETPNCDDANPCTEDHFDPLLASCAHAPSEGSCDDGSACTEGDRCVDGGCVGDAIQCDDDVECTRDLCDPAEGCVYLPNHEVCKDDDPCTLDSCTPDGCENPGAPDGHPCGDYVACDSIDVCIIGFCVSVAIPDGAPCSDGNVCTLGDLCSEGTCVGTATVAMPTVVAESFLFDQPRSASFAQNHLYLASEFDIADRFTVLARTGNDVAPVRAVRALDGSARLLPLSGSLYARVGTSTGTAHHLDVVDLAAPESPLLVLRSFRRWTILAQDPVAYTDSHLFYCASPTGSGWDAEMVSIDLSDPRNPGPTVSLGPGPCRASGATGGAYWVRFQNGWSGRNVGSSDSNGVSQMDAERARIDPNSNIQIWRLSAAGAELVVDHTYSTIGVDSYGPIMSLALDGHRLLVDLGHPTWFFVVDLDVDPLQVLPITINLGDPNWLTGVYEHTAYIQAAGQLRAVDLSNALQPVALSYALPMPGWVGWSSVLAFGDDALVLTSPQGELLIGPRTGSGTVQPFTLRGRGSIDRLYSQSDGLYALDDDTALLFERNWLSAPNAAATPIGRRWDLRGQGASFPTIVDGPDAALGVFAARRTPAQCFDSLPCDWTTLIGTATTVPSIALLPNGNVAHGRNYPIQRSDPGEQLWSTAVDGCQGIIFAPVVGSNMRSDRILIVDRCTPNFLPELRSLATIDLPTVTEYWDLRTRAHGDSQYSVLLADSAVLIDLSSFSLPAHTVLPLNGRPLADAYQAGIWALLVESFSGGSELQLWDTSGATPVLASSTPLVGVTATSLAKLWLDWPLIYLGLADGAQGELRIFDLQAGAPNPIHRVSLPARPIELLAEGNRLYLGRDDGISVINTPCPTP